MDMGRNAIRLGSWESLGRQVRLKTLDAIALHFAAKAYESGQSVPTTDREELADRAGVNHE